MEIARSIAPTRSGNGASSFGALPGKVVLPLKYASKQKGGRIRNAHLQPYELTIREPTAGPVATPSAVRAPHLATVVIRADSGKIKIGAGTNIQDNSVIHADADAEIGDNVTIGHGVICHAKVIGDGSLLGNNCTLNDGVVVGKNSLVAAGSVLNENKIYKDNALIRGTPGKALGNVKQRHTELMRRAANSYVNRIKRYKSAGFEQNRKS